MVEQRAIRFERSCHVTGSGKQLFAVSPPRVHFRGHGPTPGPGQGLGIADWLVDWLDGGGGGGGAQKGLPPGVTLLATS